MKLRIHGVAVLLTVVLAPAAIFAQAPAGTARVDSETYFDTSFSDANYSNTSFGNTSYGGSHDGGVEYTTESQSEWELFGDSFANPTHGGLLGKTHLRAAYLYNGVDSPAGASFDAFDGWDIEFSTPIPWFNSDDLGWDFITEYEHRELSGRVGATEISVDGDFVLVGVRLFAMPNSRVRPYVTLGAAFQEFKSRATGLASSSDSEQEFVTNLGVELDLASNAALRGDFEIDRDDIDDSTFEGVVILWLGENVFFRGGTIVPLTDGFDAGVTIGGGVGF